jgi:hypothetical protein
MSNQPNPLSMPESPREKRPYKPILITIVCAILLGAGSCFGFATTALGVHSNSSLATLFAVIFLACAGAFIGGLIWLFFAFILNRTRR